MTTFTTRNDLPDPLREIMITLLNEQLADTSDLYSQVKYAHWNVKGLDFIALHELFDDMASSLSGFSDTIAERATALGGIAFGTIRMAADGSKLQEFPDGVFRGDQVLKVLAQRYGAYSSSTRTALMKAIENGDQVTADVFIEISRDVDKHLWFIEAHLQA